MQQYTGNRCRFIAFTILAIIALVCLPCLVSGGGAVNSTTETDVTFLVYCLAKKALLLHVSELEIILAEFQVTNPRVNLDGEEVIISISYFLMLLLCINYL